MGSKVIEQLGQKLSASKSRIPPPHSTDGVCFDGVVTQNSVLPVLGVVSYSFRLSWRGVAMVINAAQYSPGAISPFT